MGPFIQPMLAKPATIGKLPKGSWVAEQKYDGHRLIVRVDHSVMNEVQVKAWSRLGNVRELPVAIVKELTELPHGCYDGELIVDGGTSSSVTDLLNQRKLRLVLFDVLEMHDDSVMQMAWIERRRILVDAIGHIKEKTKVTISSPAPVKNWDEVQVCVDAIWDAGGEGLILKNVEADYKPNKRSPNFLKVKEVLSATLQIIGFCPSESEIDNRGPFGTTVLKDRMNNYTVVKTLDSAEIAKLEKAMPPDSSTMSWSEVRLPSGRKVKYIDNHPFVGRELAIEYQQRTDDGSYRHPRWDHYEEE